MSTLTRDTWVLIADSEKALFIRNETDAENPNFVVVREEEQDNPKDVAQSANKPGRMQDSGVQQMSAVEDTDWHELAKERFADDLAGILFKQAEKHKFERIVLCAAPQVLGALRDKLHKEVSWRVVAEVDKNLTNHPLDQIEANLRRELESV
ncbi:Protein required for attachment to host cells [Roseivivax jejudonensis]|uniref:Protein required for attachment to host cells n=1 Tax=Roseivivax jejudonensis TaxID=1529041 RepID=A0A1X6YNC7_9RHOB|nr:host attachment family protein [Roseivivax jejudonensis]SLN26550.1 Protein required for attachment to host cells [Roseivivax jejudonensis]